MTKDEIEFLKESNAIEGVYDDDSLEQAKEAWKFIKQQNLLTVGNILKTHKILMLNQDHLQPDQKGYFRKCGIRIGGRLGMNWVKIPDAIEAWVNLVNGSIVQHEDDIKFHHVEYEHIHPFADGNGRTGRMFMNWERLRAGKPILIIHSGDEQMEYYKWFREIDPKKCGYCGKRLENQIDPLTKKPSDYIFACTCKDWPKDLQLSIG